MILNVNNNHDNNSKVLFNIVVFLFTFELYSHLTFILATTN